MGLETHTSNGLAPAVWQKITATLTGEIVEGCVAKSCLQRGIVLPHSYEAWL